jgi:hypothetical protein
MRRLCGSGGVDTYPVDLIPFIFAHAWTVGLALVIGAALGRLLPRAVPYAVLGVGFFASAYFTWMAWLLEQSPFLPIGFFVIAALLSVVAAYVVRYLMIFFEFAIFWIGWYLVLYAQLGTSLAGSGVEGVLSLGAALASMAAMYPVVRWVSRTHAAPAFAAPRPAGGAASA